MLFLLPSQNIYLFCSVWWNDTEGLPSSTTARELSLKSSHMEMIRLIIYSLNIFLYIHGWRYRFTFSIYGWGNIRIIWEIKYFIKTFYVFLFSNVYSSTRAYSQNIQLCWLCFWNRWNILGNSRYAFMGFRIFELENWVKLEIFILILILELVTQDFNLD